MRRINYDEVAHLYDEPGRDYEVDANLLTFLEGRSEIVREPVCVLDVGCGTGKQLRADRDRLRHALLVGADRSGAMLRIARERCPTVAWVQADGAALPFASASFHYATNQFSYHHIRHTRTFLTEVFRVLKAGGRFVMTNIDPWSMPGWLVYQYFPDARELDHQDFLPVDQFAGLMREIGFDDIRSRSTDLSRDEDLRSFMAYASDRHRASQLTAISDESYKAGLHRLARTMADARGDEIVTRSEFVRVMIAGDKRSAPPAG